MSATPDSKLADPEQRIADLERQLAEALEQQTATAEVLQVINSSPGDLAPVFEAILERAHRLCGVEYGTLQLYDGEKFRTLTRRGFPEEVGQSWRDPYSVAPNSPLRGLLEGEPLAEISDVIAYQAETPNPRAEAAIAVGIRSVLFLPLRRDNLLLGVISAGRREAKPFQANEVALLQNFAAQAVIAMENARLLTETREALEQQTATAEVLGVINASPGDLAPVFDALLEKATSVCDAASGILLTWDGEHLHRVAWRGASRELVEALGEINKPVPGSLASRIVSGEPVIAVADLREGEGYVTGAPLPALARIGGARSLVAVALRKEDALLGIFSIFRQEVRPFSDKQIALLQNFAAQAVIAMENARLITETREALEQQTATAEVLGVINASPGDLAPVFDAMLEKAMRLCEAAYGVLWTSDGTAFRAAAVRGVPPDYADFVGRQRRSPQPDTALGQLALGSDVVHIPDVANRHTTEEVVLKLVELGSVRTLLAVSLRKDGSLLGSIHVYRQEVRPFTDKQIALLQNFAAQAVIAMENARLITETREALEQQTATAEVLGVINASPGDLKPVFEAMLQKAHMLCGAEFGTLFLRDGDVFHGVAMRGLPGPFAERMRQGLRGVDAPIIRPLLDGERYVHIPDLAVIDHPIALLATQHDTRTVLSIPLRKDDAMLGLIVAARAEVRQFSDRDIALVENFAAQAVIAIENARLINETREALEQQTATAEVLGVINASPGDLAPVFDAILEKAMTLCGAAFGLANSFDGERFHLAGENGVPSAFAEWRKHNRPVFGPGTGPARILAGENVVHTIDLMELEAYRNGDPNLRVLVELGGARTHLIVALRKDDTLLGTLSIYRQEVHPFTDKQIALLQNFAAQAVIAMENARLITETREALEQQTATAEVLGVINSSPGDLTPVFEAILEKAHTLCGADHGTLTVFDGESCRAIAMRGIPEGFAEVLRQPFQPGGLTEKLSSGAAFVHIADLTEAQYSSDNPLHRAAIGAGGVRTLLAVPLRKENDVLLGYVTANRREVRPFSDKQIALLQNFAAQAVIAMENARLMTETREALEQQTATAEVLQVINASPGDLAPVFDAMLEKATRLCDGTRGIFWTYDGDQYLAVAFLGVDPQFAAVLREPVRLPPASPLGRVAHGEPFVQVLDMADTDAYRSGFPLVRAVVDLGKVRSLVVVPLIKDGAAAGIFAIARNEVRPFTEKQIALLQNFAAQAVIAMENARLITETREARDDAEAALGHLKAAQANLIQAEKMASLGQLTAGIAHEIKNPLNFVNNFASLSVELLDELKEVTEPAVAALGTDKRAEVDETIDMLSGNLEKIAEHGKRADNIVKSMLEHSRGVSGERREVDINNLIEEALNLAYHGARAQNQDFNITLERDYAASLKPIELAPQEITRVFLNLFGNGFYAANERAKENGDGSFRPVLAVATCEAEDAVEVRVRDNGTGIAPEIRDKLFQPFFTTKPTGEGTGLGLSISYDIITQQHGGTITVESEPGSYTAFTIRLPRQ